MQIDERAGDAGNAHRAQAGAVEALRRGDEPARDLAWVRLEGGSDDAEAICTIFDQSLDMDEAERVKLAGQPIRVLSESDRWLVQERLYGKVGGPEESVD